MASNGLLSADLRTAAALTVTGALLGSPLGLLWAAVAPRAQVQIVSSTAVSYLDPEPRAFLSADLVFLLLGLVLGAALGGLAWLLARRRAPGVVLGLVAGGLLASYLASRIGARVGREAFLMALRAGRPAVVGQSVSLLAKQCLVGLPLGALAVFALLTVSRESEVAGDHDAALPEPLRPLSSG